jgi:hypothetical protein
MMFEFEWFEVSQMHRKDGNFKKKSGKKALIDFYKKSTDKTRFHLVHCLNFGIV